MTTQTAPVEPKAMIADALDCIRSARAELREIEWGLRLDKRLGQEPGFGREPAGYDMDAMDVIMCKLRALVTGDAA
jgi:hypothetical protein